MKKIVFLLIIYSCTSTYAQKGFYTGIQCGYGVNYGGSTSFNYVMSNSGAVEYIYHPLNLGAGFVPSLAAGYFFNENLGAELGVGYLSGNTYTQTSDNLSANYVFKYQYAYSTLYMNPSIILKTSIGIIKPYAKIGVFAGLINKVTNSSSSTSTNTSNYYLQSTTESKGGLPLGFTASLGAEIAAGRHFGIYGEMFGRFATYSPSSYTTTTTYSSQPNTTYSGVYSDVITRDYSSNNNSTDLLTISNPINAIGFNVGIRYYFKGNN